MSNGDGNEKVFIERLVTVEQRSRSNTHRIDALEESNTLLTKMAENMAVMSVKQELVSEKLDDVTTVVNKTAESVERQKDMLNEKVGKGDLKEVDERVKDIEKQPGKRWNSMVEKVMFALAGAVAAYIATRLGL